MGDAAPPVGTVEVEVAAHPVVEQLLGQQSPPVGHAQFVAGFVEHRGSITVAQLAAGAIKASTGGAGRQLEGMGGATFPQIDFDRPQLPAVAPALGQHIQQHRSSATQCREMVAEQFPHRHQLLRVGVACWKAATPEALPVGAPQALLMSGHDPGGSIAINPELHAG